MARGIDTPDVTTHKAAEIKARGIDFVVRYYRSSTSHFTPLTLSEAQALKAANLFIVTVYEGRSDHKSYFSPAQGRLDARQAHQQAVAAGQPAGTPIYFAVDYDAAESHLAHNILPYFQEVKSTLDELGGEYRIGVYGSGLTCRWLKNNTDFVEFLWLAVSSGWSGHAFGDWNMKQLSSTTLLGLDVDLDETRGNGGGW